MAELLCGMAADSLRKINTSMALFTALANEYPFIKSGYVFLGEEGEILGQIRKEEGIISFYPNGAFFGSKLEEMP
jgi:hypothetical protein